MVLCSIKHLTNFEVTLKNGSYELKKAPVTAGSYNDYYDNSTHSPSPCILMGTYTGTLTCSNNPFSVGPNLGSGTVTPVVDYHTELTTNNSESTPIVILPASITNFITGGAYLVFGNSSGTTPGELNSNRDGGDSNYCHVRRGSIHAAKLLFIIAEGRH